MLLASHPSYFDQTLYHDVMRSGLKFIVELVRESDSGGHMKLGGKTALVTGGGRGIGRSIALAYANKKSDIAVVSRTWTELDETTNQVRALARKALNINADFTKVIRRTRPSKKPSRPLARWASAQ